MSRTYRPHEAADDYEAGEAPWWTGPPRVGIPQPPGAASSGSGWNAGRGLPSAAELDAVGDVGAMTVGELTAAAQMLRVSPGLLLGAATQDRVQADLHLTRGLSKEVATLVLEFARLRPDTAVVLASMVDRYATATAAVENASVRPE